MTDVAGVAVVILLGQLVAREDGVGAVDDDHMIAAVDMGREGGLMLAAQQNGSLCGHTAERLAAASEHIPLAGNFSGFRHKSGHSVFLLYFPFYHAKPRPLAGLWNRKVDDTIDRAALSILFSDILIYRFYTSCFLLISSVFSRILMSCFSNSVSL